MIFSKVYLSLGSNQGKRLDLLKAALGSILMIPSLSKLSCSAVYESSPVNAPACDDFLNLVCSFEYEESVEKLFECLQRIEKEMGKIPKAKNAARFIDIDLLFFGEKSFRNSQLELPHPRWKERLFVLQPLSELTDSICIDEKKTFLKKSLEDFPSYGAQFLQKIHH